MKRPNYCLAALLFMLSLPSMAQIRAPFTNNDLRNSLEKVINDFPRELNTIKGEVLVENPQTVEYASLLTFKGSESNTITKYLSAKPIYSWQATVLTTEDFEEAVKKYKWLFNQMKVMTITSENGYGFSLNGNYGEPDESKKFSVSTFQLTPAPTNLTNLKIEVGLQYYFPEWQVNLLVYQKEREDNERGDVND
jgi:hypothetical protein